MSKDLILGWAGENSSGLVPLVYRGEGSLFTSGKPGSAKTRGLIIPNLITYEGSVIVNDPKNEIVEQSAIWRNEFLKQDVHVFDPFRFANPKYLPKKNGKVCYGSIDLIGSIRRSQSPISTAAKYAVAMISTEKTKETHFPEGAQAIHTAIDLCVALDDALPDSVRNKKTAWNLFTDKEMFQATLEMMAESEHEYLRDQSNAFLDVSSDDREMRGIKSTMRTQCTRTYSEPALMGTLCHDSADFSKINDTPMSIYIVMPPNLMDVHFRYMRLLLTYFVAEIERGGLRRFV